MLAEKFFVPYVIGLLLIFAIVFTAICCLIAGNCSAVCIVSGCVCGVIGALIGYVLYLKMLKKMKEVEK